MSGKGRETVYDLPPLAVTLQERFLFAYYLSF